METPAGSSVAAQVKSSYFHLLAVLIAVLAALGVLNSVLMFVHVLGPGELALLTLAGRAIAAAGALGPGTWAAASRATTALHAE